MKSKICVLMLAIFMIAGVSANAQSRYSADVDLGYTLSFSKSGISLSDRINFSTTHGVMFNERFFLGAGAGFDYFFSGEGEWYMMPIYANVRGFLPVSEKTSLFASVDVGYSFFLSGYYTVGTGGFYCTPAVGLKIGSLKFQVGYNVLSLSEGNQSDTVDAIQFKIGYMF